MKRLIKISCQVTLLFVCAFQSIAQKHKVVEFTGGARSVLSNDFLIVNDSIPDTTTVKKTSGGYTLLDLGVEIRPNEKTEIMGMFRIRNDYGGFWGAGVSFDVRQLWLKGVVGNAVRYQIGDLNLKQTPFTLFNHHADRITMLPEIFKIQNEIISYDKFYKNNTWRQQGIALDFGLTFGEIKQDLDVNAFLTRLNATDFNMVPDRLMGGYSFDLELNPNFTIGLNQNSVFDVKGTVIDSNIFKNNVYTAEIQYKRKFGNKTLQLNSEIGMSNSQQTLFAESKLNDYFIYAQGVLKIDQKNIELGMGYINVGPDFRSIGAQSKDVNYNANTNYFTRYTNNQNARSCSFYDLISNANIYNASISSNLQDYNQVFNNISPFGLSTFNRQGLNFLILYHNPNGFKIEASQKILSEIRGQGTYDLKQFSQTNLITKWNVQKLFGLKKVLNVEVGFNMDNTQRHGSINEVQVDLKSNQMQASVEIELANKLDLLGGWISRNTKGNDFYPTRDKFSHVIDFENKNYNLSQGMAAIGLRTRFSKNSALTAIYQSNNNTDLMQTTADFKLNQFMVIFNMSF